MMHKQQRLQRNNLLRFALLLVVLGTATWASLGGSHSPARASSAAIVPGITWPDQNGNNVQGHGGSIIQVGSTYYWFGEDKLGENASNAFFQHIPCYASTDLSHWTFVQEALYEQSSGDLGPKRIIERPKVIYNQSTQQYVMYMHVDTPGYGTGRVGVATSSSVCGTYTYRGSFLPLGLQSWDIGLFKDDNGTAYLLTHAGDNALHIDQLSSDYLSVVSSVAALSPNYEAPAMLKANGRYYLFGSHLTGWSSNDDVYTTATSLAGPWSAWNTFAPVGSNTYNSQVDLILPVSGSQGTTYVYMGDRWNANDLGASTSVWLPLNVNGTSVSVTWYSTWSIDTSTGLWSQSGSYYRIVNRNSGLELDVSGGSTTQGAQIVQWPDHNGTNQQWLLVPDGSYYRIVNRNSGLELDVSGGSTTQGAQIIQWSDHNGTNQQWSLVSDGSYYRIVNRNSGLELDVSGGSTTQGAQIVQWPDHNGTNQQWSLVQTN